MSDSVQDSNMEEESVQEFSQGIMEILRNKYLPVKTEEEGGFHLIPNRVNRVFNNNTII